jgi:hypothetical protein
MKNACKEQAAALPYREGEEFCRAPGTGQGQFIV